MEDTVTSCLLFCYLPRKLQEVITWVGCEREQISTISRCEIKSWAPHCKMDIRTLQTEISLSCQTACSVLLTNLSTESKRDAKGFEAGASWPPNAYK